MAQVLQLVNGVPTMVSLADNAYDESIYYASGLSASSTITLPNSGSFESADAKDILITINGRVAQITTDFTVVGAGPTYTQISNVYALTDDTTINFKRDI